ncbi:MULTISPECIES: patatin-like phospholipase family protein [Pseudomonas]|uniref:patatin-like phospholipase family protein n=1 Tax=Pseudomonas TaxID=286 RepID=UPI001BE84C55|nr:MULTISPECIES: patatin-like phospholipase family protein [Pseudomonas]MBT2342092.1 patatin-like phospholipase family protein [Pseudomonas fluorescens]MCD4532219.1 patatin-like phospholipase family protein [Pseudomonas sp. C3-2018]
MPVISRHSPSPYIFQNLGQLAKQALPEFPQPLACGATDRSITLVRNEDGNAQVSMKRPPITELVLSGGGAKGVAYSGFVDTLEANGVMDTIRTISGSSAGAISAALLASGMNHEGFDRISDDIPLISLLDSTHPNVRKIQNGLSRLGEKLEKLPLAQLLCDLLPRLGSKGMPLEKLIREEACTALLQRCKEHPKPLSEEAQRAVANVERNQYVTFADLAALSKEIPQIKSVEITGTAMFEEGTQLVVFSADLTPDMDIAVAAHISASLPLVFGKPTLQGQPFQPMGATTACADGGILNNTPVPDLYNPAAFLSPIPDSEPLILVFEAEEANQETQRGTGISALVDRVLKAPHTASSAWNAKQLKHYAEQTVVVRMKTDEGDYRGLLGGTVNFRMSKDTKNHLQEELRKDVQTHLDKRDATQQTFSFASIEDALLALSDTDFEQLSAELEGDEACAEVIAFRGQAQRALAQLKESIQEANKTSAALEPTPSMHQAIWALDQLADHPGKLEWLAKRLNQGSDPDFMQFLQAATKWDKGAPGVISEVTHHAVENMHLQDIATRIRNVVQNVLNPARFLNGQPEANIKLINGVIRDLQDMQGPNASHHSGEQRIAFNHSLERVIANYRSRYTGMLNPESTTRETLRNMQFK